MIHQVHWLFLSLDSAAAPLWAAAEGDSVQR
jgi:hypothetical protein